MHYAVHSDLLRNIRGHMDPSIGILMLAIIGIVVAGPYLIRHIDETGLPDEFMDSIRLAFVVLIVAVMQVAVIAFVTYETYWDAYQAGVREGPFDKPPLLKGFRGPIVTVTCYAIGYWRLAKVAPSVKWGAITYGSLGGLVLVAAGIAVAVGCMKLTGESEEG